MRRFVKENSLTIAAALVFAVLLLGQIGAGFLEDNEDRAAHGESPIGLAAYLTSGHFTEATFENWESEFSRCRRSWS